MNPVRNRGRVIAAKILPKNMININYQNKDLLVRVLFLTG